MPRTASSFFSILDPTLSSDGVKHPNRGLPNLTPENTASIPSFAEPIPESDPTFSLVPFPLSRRMSQTATESLAFSPSNTTLSGDETKSPTRGSLRCCPDNVTIVELSSGSCTPHGFPTPFPISAKSPTSSSSSRLQPLPESDQTSSLATHSTPLPPSEPVSRPPSPPFGTLTLPLQSVRSSPRNPMSPSVCAVTLVDNPSPSPMELTINFCHACPN